jgi:hypothetical protein
VSNAIAASLVKIRLNILPLPCGAERNEDRSPWKVWKKTAHRGSSGVAQLSPYQYHPIASGDMFADEGSAEESTTRHGRRNRPFRWPDSTRRR